MRVAEITRRIVQVIEEPRKLLPEFFRTPESAQVAVCYRSPSPSTAACRQVYIGHMGNSQAHLAADSQVTNWVWGRRQGRRSDFQKVAFQATIVA